MTNAETGKQQEITTRSVMAELNVVIFMCVTFAFYLFSESVCSLSPNMAHTSLCRIRGKVAVCSGHGRNLTYIPTVPSNVITLRFSFNHLPQVSTNTFINVTYLKLKTLHLVGNHIELISKTAFQVLKHLKYLDISHNKIRPDILAEAFIGLGKTPIRRLDIIAMDIHLIPSHFFDNLKFSQINTIHMHQNYLTVFNCSDFSQLKYLKHVGMAQNVITILLASLACTPAEVDVSFNSIKNPCKHGIIATSIELLDIQSNGIYHVDPGTFSCFPMLNALFLGGNYITRLPQNTFAALPKLGLLSMVSNPNLKLIEEGAFNSSILRKLLLINNGQNFDNYQYNLNMFKGSRIKSLDISKNNFQIVSSKALQRLFKPIMNSLEVLVMSEATLTAIPQVIASLTNLKRLQLSNNLISVWAPETFSFITDLQLLDLSHNSISVVQEGSFPDNILRTLKSVKLFTNPFDCSCANLWFIGIFQAHLDIFDNSGKSCRCSSPPKKVLSFLRDVHMTDNSCLLNFISQLIVIVTTSILATICVIGLLLYKYRWHLRYFLYMHNNRRRRENPEVNEEHFLYDVFVVYSSEDSDWVLDKLVPKLEGELGFRVCVHERNFVPGKLIVDNIVTSIDSSKKIMVVLSNSFSQRDWCQFELNVVQRHVLEKGQDLLVVVVLEQLNRRHMTPTMFTMLQTTTYIQWPDDVDSEERFWNNLSVALPVK